MSDMLAVEQETNNDVRQFLNKINELRNKAPKNEETLSLIHISEPTRQAEISYAVFCLKKKKKTKKKKQNKNKKQRQRD